MNNLPQNLEKMDRVVKNFKKGIVSKPINLDIGILGDNKSYETHLFDFYREQDKAKFEKLLEKEGALWWKFEEIPGSNVWGQLILTQWVCIYIHTEGIEMEVLC